MTQRNRIYWHCRRGILELDLILAAFMDRGYDTLSAHEEELFMEILDYPDDKLWDLVSGKDALGHNDKTGVIEAVRNSMRAGLQAAF